MNALVALGQKCQQQKKYKQKKRRVIQKSITCKVLYNATET